MFPEDRFVEILIIGALALIFIGPKDLPVLMRRLGRFIGKMRGMAAEFRASFDELARQSELDELRKEVEALRHSQIPTGSLGSLSAQHVSAAFDELDRGHGAEPAPQMLPLAEPTEPAASDPESSSPAPKATRKPRVKAIKTAGEAP